MAQEQSGRETRMLALPNVTVSESRRSSRTGRVSMIDDSQRDRLATNRNLLLKNVTVTHEMLDVCEEKGIISASQRLDVENMDETGEGRMEFLLTSMNLQETSVFMRFCDVLTLMGHPLIADYLRDSGYASKTFGFEELWEQIPSLNKNLHKWEKEKLTAYITGRIKEEVLKFNIGEIQEERSKEMEIRQKQVQQSWKFQREIKDKDQVATSLQNKILELESLLVEKEQEAAQNRMTLQRDIDKLSSNVQVAAKFNMANDSALRRMRETLDLHTAFAGYLEERLGPFDPATRPAGPLLREETPLDGLRQQFDPERRIDNLKRLLGLVFAELEELRALKARHEALLDTVHFLRQQMRPSEAAEAEHDAADAGEGLRRCFLAFSVRMDEQLGRQRAELELLDSFVHGRLAPEEVPPPLADLELPAAERQRLQGRIDELERSLEAARAQLDAARAAGAGAGAAAAAQQAVPALVPNHRTFRSTEAILRQTRPAGGGAAPYQPPGPPAPSQAPVRERAAGGGAPNIPFSYHSRRTQREARTRPDPKPLNAKVLSTRVVNF